MAVDMDGTTLALGVVAIMKGNLMIDSLMEHQSLDETLDFTAPVVDEPEHDEVTTPEILDRKTTLALWRWLGLIAPVPKS